MKFSLHQELNSSLIIHKIETIVVNSDLGSLKLGIEKVDRINHKVTKWGQTRMHAQHFLIRIYIDYFIALLYCLIHTFKSYSNSPLYMYKFNLHTDV